MEQIFLDGNSLTFEQISQIVYENVKVSLTKKAIDKIVKCRQYVEQIIDDGKIVYGLTTGFGKFANIKINKEDIALLQKNLIESHAVAVGANLSVEETRAIMLLRINVLAKGHSGIRLQTLQTLIDMLNFGIHPLIPEKGSVGASGDLSPLSHLALVVIGKGKAELKGEIMEGAEALSKASLKPIILQAKEGLALNNGTQVMTGIGVLTLLKAEHLCRMADVIAAATIDALKATSEAFNSLVHKLRPHRGQLISAENIFSLLEESEIRKNHQNCENVQDAYSLRCSSQVHGAVRDALRYTRESLEVEINSATDNPLIFPDEDKVISGGNFHGEPIAIACDTMGMSVAELANISERRIEQMYNPALNRGLNAFLAPTPGIDSGFMIAQLTAASLVSENKVLSHPSCVDSIPTSANQEDHVSMGTISAVNARTIIDNVSYVLGIELMSAVQALDASPYKSSPSLQVLRGIVREEVRKLEKDRFIQNDILKMKSLIQSDKIIHRLSQKIK